MSRHQGSLALIVVALAACATTSCSARPNVLVIVADDLGYSDIGAFGGEIPTPNLDTLARTGTLLTRFYAAPACSPTRAMLLTGVDHHLAGLGTMAEFLTDDLRNRPGYEGYLNNRVVTVATRLSAAGYRTAMAGKWHLGTSAAQSPSAKGFQRSFALLDGGASHFADMGGVLQSQQRALYREDGELVETLPDGFFSSDFYTERIIRYIDESVAHRRPFFAYLALTAPHWPLQVPDTHLHKYLGKYDAGYDYWRSWRLARQQQLGIIAADVSPAPADPAIARWDTLSPGERAQQARAMEIYAAMIDNLDANLGRVFAHLRRIGSFDNTFILFLSDNGPSASLLQSPPFQPFVDQHDNSLDNMGRRGSFVRVGPGWAQVSAVPLRRYKGLPAEGGIRVPAIAKYPGQHRSRRLGEAITVRDIAPTILELSGVTGTAPFESGKLYRPSGRSFAGYLAGATNSVWHDGEPLGWELFGQRALHKGTWKALWLDPPHGKGNWQLYDIVADPGESKDLAEQHADKLHELIGDFNAYSSAQGIAQ